MKCKNRAAGCEWSGELSDLKAHLRRSCAYVFVECSIGCGDLLMRGDLEGHVEHHCFMRTVRCKYCDQPGAYEVIVDEHYESCPSVPVACPNGCSAGAVFPRAELSAHAAVCPVEPVTCTFSELGCGELVARKDLSSHLNAEQGSHLSLMQSAIVGIRQSLDGLRSDAEGLREELQQSRRGQEELNKALKSLPSQAQTPPTPVPQAKPSPALGESPGRLTVMEQHLEAHTKLSATNPFLPVVIKMEGFARLRHSRETWYSKPFYTAPLGYRLCLCVYADGCCSGSGTHLSVFVHVMRGPFDSRLEWPIGEEVMVSLQNQCSDAHHWEVDCGFWEDTPAHVCARVTSSGASRAKRGSGSPTFCPLTKLQSSAAPRHCHYLRRDCLFFEVR